MRGHDGRAAPAERIRNTLAWPGKPADEEFWKFYGLGLLVILAAVLILSLMVDPGATALEAPFAFPPVPPTDQSMFSPGRGCPHRTIGAFERITEVLTEARGVLVGQNFIGGHEQKIAFCRRLQGGDA